MEKIFLLFFFIISNPSEGKVNLFSHLLTPDEYLLEPAHFSEMTNEEEETLHYDAEPDRGVNIRGVYCYAGGVRFTAPESLTILAVLFYLTDPANLAIVYIRDQRSSLQPGPIIDSFRTNSAGQGVWKRANLPRPILIPAGRDFWTTVTVWHSANYYPLTLDLGPMVPERGGFISLPTLNETLWYQLTDPPFWTDRNWNIRAVVKWSGGTDIKDKEKRILSSLIVPNPAKGNVTVYLPAGEEMVSLKVYNHLGEVVYSAKNRKGVFQIKGLPRGVYLLKLEGEKTRAERKLVVLP
uniref:T9SS type A sorting domain-containing protein n=1 Tax=candidate division WOR-3 bacterium TaxID=2052148 RepID=A0A7C3Z207_UNCW3